MASSSYPSFTPDPAEYDVFLSFRGADTRDNFTSHLYAALCKKQIRSFIDPQVLDSRDEIAPSLLKAIEGSKVSVVIFSEGYASSTWCLDELVKILECKKLNGQIVLPVFYHVSPNDVRRQRGRFGNGFLQLEKRFKDMPEKVQLWRAALTDAGNLYGWDSALIRPESMLVEEIVKDVLKKLEDTLFSSDFEGLIGIESRLEKVLSLLCLESLDVRIVGIWGMTGIGKTTIAEVVFNLIQKDFEGKCFMSDVGEESEKSGLLRVRDRVVAQLLEENHEVGRAVLTQFTKNRLRRKKVLIVLDGVNKFTQLYSLIGGLGQFGLGSRIIVTTRVKRVLLNYGVDDIYEVERLNYQESFVLFCNYAFRQNQCPQEFVMLSKKVVDFANGSPLALKVLGSFFCRNIKQEWKYVVQEQMHDLLGETGLDIAFRESGIEPGNRSELWFDEDVYQVKEKNKKVELVPFSKGDKLVSLFKLKCDRLDSHAIALKSKKDLKQLRLKLAEIHYLLQDTECVDLRGIIYDVDQLIDDWEQSEMSKSKFEQEVRRIHGRLLQILNSFHKLDAGHDAVDSAISHGSSRKYDEYPLSETDIDRFINQVIYELLRDVNVVRIVPLVGTRGIGNTVLTQRVYTDEKMKSHFPFRFWFSVGKNLDLSTIVKAIALQYREMVDCRDVLCKRLLIVLDDVCEIDDEQLESFRLLISNMLDSGSCVLLSTHSLHLATRMSSVPAGHLTWWPEFHSPAPFKSEFVPSLGAADSPVIQHELMAPEAVVMTEPHRHSISGGKDEVTSNLSGHFGVVSEIVPASDTEPMSDLDEDPASGPKNLTEDEVTLPPQTEELATHVPGNTTISDGLFQNKGDQVNPMLNFCVNQSVEVAVPKEAIGLGPINLTAVKSMKRNVQKIVRYVNDVTVSTVGVHGIGGIGKTTLLKALINHSEIQHRFQVIVFVTVSRYGNIRKIQNEVLRQLSLSREDYENDSQVAERLWHILNIKKFLLLLDDVWGQIDLKAVGVPFPGSENGCKLLMASRKIDVFHNMNVSKVIEIETLSRKEAWELFYEQVGGIIQLPAIKPSARAIVKGCHGLPLLIIVTGKALMEENDVIMWKHASRKFSLPNTDGVCHTKDVIQRLKFSFDQLKDPDIKSCFIQCVLFPEDQEVTVVELIESCIQEGIITGTEADAHKRGCDIVDVLAKASLVQVTEDGNTITMHGLIRDLALGILSAAADDDQSLLRAEGSQLLLRAYSRLTESLNIGISSASSPLKSPEADQFFLGAGAGLREPPLEAWKQAKMVFLMDNELCTLPETLSCSNLLILSLQRNFQLRDIPPSFFNSMTSLKFLNLSNSRIKSLPNTISELRKLQILILRDCERLTMLPSEVGSLVSLEVLDLRGTEIYKLPDEIVYLASLRYLEVLFYGSIDEVEYAALPCNLISRDIISRLQALEALSIVVFPGDERWCQDVEYVISEVSGLTKLSSLRFHFPQTQHVKEFLEKSMAWRDQQLTKFNFVVGYDVKSITSRVPDSLEFDYNQHDKCLRIVNGECLRNVNGEKICPTVIQILARSDAFYLDHHLDIESLSDFGLSNIKGLKFCIISECPRIKTVVNNKEHTAAVFPSLENLNINLLWNLTCIWEGTVPRGSLAELRILSVRTCPKLEFILTRSMVEFLTKLEELTVEDCGAIGSIMLEGEIIDSSSVMLPSLKRLRLHDLPELVNIWKNVGSSVEHISIFNCPKLKKMGMESSKLKDTLIEIKAEKKCWDELQWDDIDMPSNLEDRLTIIS